MVRMLSLLFLILFCFAVFSQVDTSKSKFWMMTYFVNGGGADQDYGGPRLAFSSDTTGVRWIPYGGTNPVSTPTLFKPVRLSGADGSRCRDPMIAYDSLNKVFNMVWTTEWTGKVIGWDTSSLLKRGTWGPQVGLGVSTSIPNCNFSWAPEIFWDDIQNKWMIYWSVSASGTNTKMYYSLVEGRDFRTFSTPQVLFDPDYKLIDGSIIKVGPGNYQMFFKDERENYKYIRRAYGATTPQGPFNRITERVTGGGTEGPTIFRAGGQYRLIVDYYPNKGMSVASARNIDTALSPWPENYCYYGPSGTSRLYVSHCNVIEVPKMLVKWMFYNDSAWVRYVNNQTAIQEIRLVPSATLAPYRPGGGMKLFDLTGRVVRVINGSDAHSTIYIKRLPAGCYLASLGNDNSAEVKTTQKK